MAGLRPRALWWSARASENCGGQVEAHGKVLAASRGGRGRGKGGLIGRYVCMYTYKKEGYRRSQTEHQVTVAVTRGREWGSLHRDGAVVVSDFGFLAQVGMLNLRRLP